MSEQEPATILLIEDDAEITELVRRKLGENGWELAHAQSGKAALAWLDGHQPQLILLNYSLPDMSGAEFVEQIPKMPPFIVTTGAGNETIAVDMMKRGARDYLVKDIHFLDNLPLVVEHHLKEIANEHRLEQAERALKESEARYRTLFEQAPIGILSFDQNTVITSCNACLSEIMGVPPEKLIGVNILVTVRDERQKVALQAALAGNVGVFEGEYTFVTGGQTHFIRSTYTPFLNAAGAVEGGMCITEDISERKQAEENLRQMNERFSLATRAAGLGVWDWDIQNNQLIWDDQMYELYGVKKANFAMPYAAWLAGLHPDDVTRSNIESEQARRGEKEYDTEFRVVWPDGSIHHIKAYGQVIRAADGTALRMTGVNYDITTSKQAEEALREREAHLQAIYNAAGVAIALTDPTGRWLEANQHWLEILGYSEDELLQISTHDITHPDDLEMTIQNITDILEGRVNSSRFEKRYLTKGGATVWIDLSIAPLRDKNGQLIALVRAGTDISERKRTEEALLESEKRFRNLFENSLDGVALHEIVLNEQGEPDDYIYLMANQSYETHTGLHVADVLGKRITQIIPDIKKSNLIEIYGKVALTGEPISFETYFEPLQRYYAITSYQVGKGRFAAVFEDITERKHAENALRESEARFRLSLINAPVSVAAQDRDLRFIWAYNQRTVDPNWIIGKTDTDIFAPETAEQVLALKRQVLSTEKEIRQQLWVNSSGKRVFLDMYLEPLRDRMGQVVGIGIATVDLTQTKLAEEALSASLAEKEILLKEVHHRVKNNLASISALINLQQDQITDPAIVSEFADLGRRIQSMALVHELLYQTKTLSQIDMDDYLKTLVTRLDRSYQSRAAICLRVHAAGVTMNLDNAIPCGLIVNELVTNAFKYAFPEGRPRPGWQECEITVQVEWDGTNYTLTVCDNGVGLPPGFNWMEAQSLGMQLVMLLGQNQLAGQVELDCSNGTTVRLHFTPKKPKSLSEK
jgi:PAS domain S-box-containing protein